MVSIFDVISIYKKQKEVQMIEIIVITLIPVFHFLSDGFYDEGKKTLSSYFFSAFLAGICSLIVFDLNPWYILYLLLCWYIFEILYNIVRKLGWFYVGKTKWIDRLVWKISFGNASHASFVLKLMAAAGIVALFYTGRL